MRSGSEQPRLNLLTLCLERGRNITLSETPTCELCAELSRREAVQEFAVEPYKPFDLTIDGKEVTAEINGGPARIFIVWD